MPNAHKPKVGEIWAVDFGPQVGREQAGFRPGLVVSVDRFNELENGLILVVPLTSKNRQLVHHVQIFAPEGGLKKDSVIMCDQIKSQSIERFYDRLGVVTPETLEKVLDIISSFLGR